MRRLARWHIWLGWLVGVPMLLWTLSGVLMVVRPIEDVRGTHLRLNPEQRPALTITPAQITAGPGQTISELRSFMQHGRAITLATAPDGRITRYDAATGAALPPLDEAEARVVLRSAVRGGDQVTIIRGFDPRNPPLDLRKPVAVWQATLTDGTRVYINRDSGEIEAVRTRWWRFYDFM
ncbi:hypothetical protein [Tsuneonella aeria]|uniref:hypothetical protein n=1 Tax=Tsuneonella aeria TaxID=1837929 RepID=UPI001F2B5B68|nr:hypothetical protein [Tsuneonella aeria]